MSLSVRHNWIGGTTVNSIASTPWWLELVNFVGGQFGSITGDITENIYYNTTGVIQGEDIINATSLRGTASVPFSITRNRFWTTIGGTAAGVQFGDGTNNFYITAEENTFIDLNTAGQFSAGNNHKFLNNKIYTSEANPAKDAGAIFHVYRGTVSPGDMHSCTYENNTALHFKDVGSGTLVEIGIWNPVDGQDGLQPNHGTLAQGSVDPAGLANNNNSYSAWANGVGKSELWRASWNSFVYAGTDGDTPTISYDSPWIGDGGSQLLVASSTTETAFGDGAEINAIQSHSVLNLVSGGSPPYTLTSVGTTQTNCTVNVGGVVVAFAAGGSAGAFTYTYTVTDANSDTASGTVSGTLVDSTSGTQDYFDQDSTEYIAINPINYDEIFERNGYTFDLEGTGPYSTSYVQVRPYSGTIASGDVETDAGELVYRCHFDAAGDYSIYIMGMALGSSNYDSIWVGWDNSVDATPCTIPTDDSTFRWTNSTASINIATNDEEHDLHVWVREGGFALGAIEVYDDTGLTPKAADATTSPETQSARNAY